MKNVITRCSAECEAPAVRHGEVTGAAGEKKLWTGRVKCLAGYSLVGSNLLKCRDGQWSGQIPVCVKLGQFQTISHRPIYVTDLHYYCKTLIRYTITI